MRVGFLGLGKMGKRMVWKLLSERHDVVVWNRSSGVVEELVEEYENIPASDREKMGQFSVATYIEDFEALLHKPRIFWIMVPSGDPTNSVLERIADIATEGDIVIDGGNSYFKDSQKWFERFKKMNVRFLGVGVSGGVLAAENGFSLMVGGDESAYTQIKPILRTFAFPNGAYDYFGTGGVGHFIKMVHNGIEYGMMQAIGEGFGVVEKGPYTIDLQKVASVWQKGAIISSFLLDRASDALQADAELKKIVGDIDATGEAEWTIAVAEKEDVPIQVIKDAFAFRKKSKTDAKVQRSFAARMVAALRHEFGGHKVKEK